MNKVHRTYEGEVIDTSWTGNTMNLGESSGFTAQTIVQTLAGS